MRVFVTGGSGLVGSATIPKLVAAGHTVSALSRKDSSDAQLRQLGASEIVRGGIVDLEVLKNAAGKADAAIHAAFDHVLAFQPGGIIEACEKDRAAITAICDGLAESGKNKTFIYTSGLLGLDGPTELSKSMPNPHWPRYLSEQLTESYAAKGVRTIRARLPPVVHNKGYEHPFIASQITAAKKAGFVGQYEDGSSQWYTAHADDVADVLVLALEKGPSGSALHTYTGEPTSTKDISEFLGRKMNLPVKSLSGDEADAHFGVLARIVSAKFTADNKLTKEWTGWAPEGKALFETIDHYKY